MDTAIGTWLDTVDYTIDFPGEPLVQVGIPKESPFHRALRIEGLSNYTAFYGDQQQYGGGAHGLIASLAETEMLLLKDGADDVAAVWRQRLGRSKTDDERIAAILLRESEYNWEPGRRLGIEDGLSGRHWVTRSEVPNMIALTPVSAALYLAAIGLSTKPVPLCFARALLNPRFAFPSNLAELTSLKAGPETTLHTLWVDDQHRLVILDKPVSFGYERRPRSDGESRPVHVLSDGWRLRSTPIFTGCPIEPAESNNGGSDPWPYDHDGARLVHLHPKPPTETTKATIPVVELADIVPDLVSLFNDIRANPAKLLDADERERLWAEKRRDVSAVARRIVETALREFTPWPYPFKGRTEAEQRLPTKESEKAVVALFDRLLHAPGPLRPTDLTAYFISLITRRRAEFTAWPEECAGVWGFKIKTGDHNWIDGRIWHEPDVEDNPADPVEFTKEDTRIEAGRYRDRFRHRVELRTGSLRCHIERVDN
jgi:hypothetical protein